MIRRRRHARFPVASSAAGNDTDALQTDVMRFMSIIGLCLMAVFALVQSIPLQQPDKPVHREEPDRQFQAQREALVELEQVSLQKQKTIDELRGQLLLTQQQLDQGRKAIEAGRRKQLAKTVKPVARKPPPPAPVERSVSEQPPAEPVSRPLPPKQGFSLRFASAAVLDQMVASGNVRLYGMRNQQAWQLTMLAGTPGVTTAAFPKQFHEMSAATVPTHYLHSLKNTPGVRGTPDVVWGVHLPATTSTAIASLLQQQQAQGRQGGALVIQRDGRVTLEQ